MGKVYIVKCDECESECPDDHIEFRVHHEWPVLSDDTRDYVLCSEQCLVKKVKMISGVPQK